MEKIINQEPYGYNYLNFTVNNENPLVRLFFKWKFNKAIRMLGINKDDIILDFGCDGKYLKSILPEYNILCYDIDPKVNEVKDYTKTKPNKIFAFDVLEHLPKEELRETIENFKKMNPNFEIIIVTPYETWIWKLLRKMLGLSHMNKDHLSNLKEIVEVCEKANLKIINQSNFLWLSYIYKFKYN